MNPYETDPARIPENDQYGDIPQFGRYLPQSDDFRPEPKFVNSTTPEALEYWEGVLSSCTEKFRIYENGDGGRDVFAFGTTIIKSSHLKPVLEGRRKDRDYSYADANEVKAVALVRELLQEIKVPLILFASKIHGRDVLVQSRIPGIGLNVAWQHLNPEQKASFKKQAQELVRLLHTIPSPFKKPSYIVPDTDPVSHRGVQVLEAEILFNARKDENQDLSFTHNDTSQSNLIVNNDRIVGLVDWEMAGFFGWKRARDVHEQIRSPRREGYAHLGLSEEFMNDILYWSDMYDGA